jgi:hypothetical protein
MKLLTCIVIFYCVIYHSKELNDYRIISITGEKLQLYTGLYYAIVNKKSGIIWTSDYNFAPSLDQQNASHWHKFSKQKYGYSMSNNRYNFDFFKTGDNYYLIKQLSIKLNYILKGLKSLVNNLKQFLLR